MDATRREAGFTMVEVMIALLILAFGVLGTAAAQLTAMDYSRKSRSLTQAFYLAEQQIETFHFMSAADVAALAGSPNDPNNPIDPIVGDEDTTTYNRSWQIQIDTPEVDVMTISVRVDWTDEVGQNRRVQLDTMKADF